MKSITTLLGVPSLVAVLALSTGCATTSDLEEVKAMAMEAQQEAAEAKAMASDASADAQQAQQQTMETDQKIDEMFKKTMQK